MYSELPFNKDVELGMFMLFVRHEVLDEWIMVAGGNEYFEEAEGLEGSESHARDGNESGDGEAGCKQ
jgi:hypothetical protein